MECRHCPLTGGGPWRWTVAVVGGWSSTHSFIVVVSFLTLCGVAKTARNSSRSMGAAASTKKTVEAGFEAADKNKDGNLDELELKTSLEQVGATG